MPELPEVETVRRQLEPELVGKRIVSASVLDERLTRPEPPKSLERAVAGREVTAVARRGKYLLVGLEGGRTLAMHLRMTGNLLLRDSEHGETADLMKNDRLGGPRLYEAAPEPSHVRARFELDDGRTLVFTDVRRFGQAVVLDAGDELEDFFAARLGVEPLSGELTPERLLELAENRTAPLKSFLLTQSRVAGIGNIYADEALWRARLHPLSPAGSMKHEHATRLVEGIVDALEAGLDHGGASIDDYLDSRGERGSMQDEFLVHTREGEACRRDDGGVIQRIVVTGRSTYYFPVCQERLRRRPRLRGGEGEGKGKGKVTEPLPLPDGFAVGHWSDPEGLTGCSVVIPPAGTRGGIWVQGGGPGTRESDTLSPLSRSAEATAVLLTGGSAFGLAAADGVARWLEQHEMGYPTPFGRVPLVPSAVIYDLGTGDPKARPGPEEGYAACEQAHAGVPDRGAVGVGTGATVAKVLGRERGSAGGFGYAAMRTGAGETVAAVAAVNAAGDVLAEDGSLLVGPVGDDGEMLRGADHLVALEDAPQYKAPPEGNTTLACVCTDAALSKTECTVVARAAIAGIARAVDPTFTPVDGDIVFCLASGEGEMREYGSMQIGVAAAMVVAAAIRDAVRQA